MISFYIDNKPDIFSFLQVIRVQHIHTSPLAQWYLYGAVPRADRTITKTKNQEQKNLTKLEKQIEEYYMLIWFLQEYFEIQNWMNDINISLLSSLEFLTSKSSLAEERRIWLLEISNWQPEYKICKQGILYSNALPVIA